MDDVTYDGNPIGSSTTRPGQFYEPTFQATVTDGELSLSFDNQGNYYQFKLDGLRIQHPMTVSAGPDQSANQGSVVNFAGQAFPGIGATYSWNFGDGTTATGSPSAQHVYEEGGSYLAKLTVTDGFGDSMSSTANISVAYVAPTVSISGMPATTPSAGTSIDLGATATDPSTTVTAAGYKYSWAIDKNGVPFASGTGPSMAFTPDTEGKYTASVTALDEDGVSGTSGVTIAVVSPSHLPVIQTPNDTIPNFVAHPTIVSVASGNWSNPATWSSDRVPAAGDIVEIAGGTTVTYDVASTAHLGGVGVDPQATLEFRTDINTEMYVTDMVVFYGGTLQVGTAASPVAPGVTSTILINNVPLDAANDPSQYGNGLIALGTVTIHGAPKDGYEQLATAPRAGDATLTLATPAAGWRVGDELFLPDTRQLDWNQRGSDYVPEYEYPIIAGISANGLVLTLSAPLAFDHPGAEDGNGTLTYLPQVADLTRNVVVRSESGAGTRGQVMFLWKADVDVEDAEFLGLGRTTINPTDDTTYDSSGDVTHVGTNEEDRNAVQFRDLIGPATPQADGFQYTFVDNSVFCPIMENQMIWPININNSSYGLIQGNDAVDWWGAGIVTKTGAEIDNTISGNFVGAIQGTGTRVDTPGTGRRRILAARAGQHRCG